MQKMKVHTCPADMKRMSQANTFFGKNVFEAMWVNAIMLCGVWKKPWKS